MTDAELEAILVDARDFNEKHTITGILLYSDGVFMQYFEGAENDMRETYKRIIDSSQHKDVTAIINEPIDTRHFPDWLMGLAKVKKSELSKFQAVDIAERFDGESAVVRMLKRFWYQGDISHL